MQTKRVDPIDGDDWSLELGRDMERTDGGLATHFRFVRSNGEEVYLGFLNIGWLATLLTVHAVNGTHQDIYGGDVVAYIVPEPVNRVRIESPLLALTFEWHELNLAFAALWPD